MISVGVGAAFARPVHRAPVAVAETDPTPVPTRSAPSEASRSDVRSPAPPAAVPQVPARPRPVAGLSQPQMDNAAVIVGVGRSLGLPVRAHLVALSTALQESGLRVLANPTVPESLRYPHQGVEADYDSVGLFQQRATQGWGPVALLMDPVGSTRLFYQRLVQVPGWQSLTVTAAAQAVQRSAFPDAYAGQQARAQQVLDAL